MKKKNTENYLERIPVRAEHIGWSLDGDSVTLEIENKGIMNRIFQVLMKKPKITYIHLDENGSFVWQQIDGNLSITEIGMAVSERFGNDAEPLYERLAQFFKILETNKFIGFRGERK